MRSHGRSMYGVGHQHFWIEKKDDFARTAHEQLEKYVRSERHVLYIASYFYDGLELYGAAIDALYAAHRKRLLGLDGRYTLCCYLQWQERWGESIPLLVPMIAKRPDHLEYRTMLMLGYFHTGDREQLVATLREADATFKELDRWQEPVIASLANACCQTHLFEECCAYYEEAIALHVKSAPNRGIGDGTLSYYYRDLAAACSGLGKVAEAVDAAAGAIISWGPDMKSRQEELYRLDDVLRAAEDLDDYVVHLDAEVAETGLENPIIRKSLGKLYLEKDRYEKAARQLQLAVEVQPNDLETHRMLVLAYDKMKQPDRAIAQLLESIILSGHNPDLYRDLGKRWEKRQQHEHAERAHTNLVEVMPNESEGHQALAEVRVAQKRWGEAARHWRHVIRIRTKEPTGYLGLARALISQQAWDEAREVLEQLLGTPWP